MTLKKSNFSIFRYAGDIDQFMSRVLERPFLEPLSLSNNLPVCSEPGLDVGFLLACQAVAHAPLPPFSVAAGRRDAGLSLKKKAKSAA